MAQTVVDVNTLLRINQVIAAARLVDRYKQDIHGQFAVSLEVLRQSLADLDAILAEDPAPF